MVSRLQHHGRKAFRVLGDVLAPIAADYEIVFIDCPPESTILSDLALAAARWVLMPTKSDCRWPGRDEPRRGTVHPRQGDQPAARPARGGPVRDRHALARHPRRSPGGDRRAFGGSSPRFETTIRHAERTAQDARRLGKLAHELEVEVAAQPAWWEALRIDIRAPRVSPTAASVAGDYRALGVEVLTALQAAEESERSGAPGAPTPA